MVLDGRWGEWFENAEFYQKPCQENNDGEFTFLAQKNLLNGSLIAPMSRHISLLFFLVFSRG